MKIKEEVIKFSVYYPDLLKTLLSSRTGLQFEKKREIRENSAWESNKNDNLSEGRDDT